MLRIAYNIKKSAIKKSAWWVAGWMERGRENPFYGLFAAINK